MRNYLTIDVEDYYQVSAFEPIVGTEKWDQYPSRVVRNTRRLLEVLDHHGVTATFFILGWIGERHPGLVKEIAERGHAVACHSHRHRLIYELSPEQFEKDTRQAKDVLEQIIGRPVLGYRAPSYSITRQSSWAYEILSDLGFEYSPSVFPIHHDRYGMPEAPRFRFTVPGRELVEYPISTVRFLSQNIPVSGGGYFRIFPYWLTKMGLSRINTVDRQPFVFFVHPGRWIPVSPG